jgi:asparagine synthase (glutamine-hydrolysing)
VPRVIRDFVISPCVRLIPESNRYLNTGRVLREFTRAAALSPKQRYLRWVSTVKEETRRRLYKEPYLVAKLDDEGDEHLSGLFDRQSAATPLGRMLYADTNRELPNDILLKVDRMSMACSLEVRSPLLDHHLFEFAATLPDRAKLNGWTTKYLLKKVAAKLLPSDLLKRPKHGFSVPLNRWFREDLADPARAILLDSRTRSRGFFHPQAVERILEDHVARRGGYGREIWTLLTMELWCRMYVDGFEYMATPTHCDTTPA